MNKTIKLPISGQSVPLSRISKMKLPLEVQREFKSVLWGRFWFKLYKFFITKSAREGIELKLHNRFVSVLYRVERALISSRYKYVEPE